MEIKKEKDKVCIIGCASSRDKAPFHDPSYEFWGVNNLFLHMKNVPWSKWFEIHSIGKDQDNHFVRRTLIKEGVFIWDRDFRGTPVDKYVEELAKFSCPVIMQGEWAEIPTSVPYPIAQMKQLFGNYLTNTVSYEIALAIALGYSEIGIYGVDMAVGSEYGHQRPSCEYFVGIALGKGIKVTIPAEADLCKTRHMYAFEDREADAWEKKLVDNRKMIMKQVNEAEQTLRMAQKKLDQGIGAVTALDELNKIWGLNK